MNQLLFSNSRYGEVNHGLSGLYFLNKFAQTLQRL